jgi:hypothetical protein
MGSYIGHEHAESLGNVEPLDLSSFCHFMRHHHVEAATSII